MSQMSKVDCSRGAPMGRMNHFGLPGKDYKLSLTQVRLNQGGYDDGGAYWGLGSPLWCATSKCGEVVLFVRAVSRDVAKANIVEIMPKAKFYR